MVTTDSAVLTANDYLARAREFVPLLAAGAAEVDGSRHLATETVDALADAGLFSLGVPQRFGGPQTSMRTQLEVSAILGKGCSSTAWCVQNVNASAVITGMFSDQAQRDVWQDNPGARVCGSQTPAREVERVEDGWIISGSWGFVSGVEQAQWGFLSFDAPTSDGPPHPHFALVPITDGTIEDTWFMTGMRGTASNTLHMDKVFVPDHRTLALGPAAMAGVLPTEHKDEALYRTPIVSALTIILIGSPLGMAEAAREYVIASAPKRGIAYSTFASQDASTAFQLAVAEATLMIDSAKLQVLELADMLDRIGESGEMISDVERARLRATVGFVGKLLRESVQILLDAHGTAAFSDRSPLQRIWRDLNTATRHGMLTPALGYESYGKVLLGRDERVAFVL